MSGLRRRMYRRQQAEGRRIVGEARRNPDTFYLRAPEGSLAVHIAREMQKRKADAKALARTRWQGR